MLDDGLVVTRQELHEWLLEFSVVDAAVLGDVELGEEALVEHPPLSFEGTLVEPVAVGGQRQGGVEGAGQFLFRAHGRLGAAIGLLEFAGQAIHFALEHVQRDRSGVVCFEEFLPFVVETRALARRFGYVPRGLNRVALQLAHHGFSDERCTFGTHLE